MISKQASFTDKPIRKLKLIDTYERQNEQENHTYKPVTPDHEVRADINNMLESEHHRNEDYCENQDGNGAGDDPRCANSSA